MTGVLEEKIEREKRYIGGGNGMRIERCIGGGNRMRIERCIGGENRERKEVYWRRKWNEN